MSWKNRDRRAIAIFKATSVVTLLLLVKLAVAQSNVYSIRVIGHLPFYERIFLAKGDFLRPATLRGIDDLKPAEHSSETNRIDRLFSDPLRERTNSFYASCLSEIPLSTLTLQCPGRLLSEPLVQNLLRDTVAIPRTLWTNQASRREVRYVFSLIGPEQKSFVIDLRSGGFAIIYFPDGTYRCVVGPGYGFLPTVVNTAPSKGTTNSASSSPPH